MLLPVKLDQLQLVMFGDAFAQIVEEFDDGLCLLWRPVGRDSERDGEGRPARETCCVMILLRGVWAPFARRARWLP